MRPILGQIVRQRKFYCIATLVFHSVGHSHVLSQECLGTQLLVADLAAVVDGLGIFQGSLCPVRLCCGMTWVTRMTRVTLFGMGLQPEEAVCGEVEAFRALVTPLLLRMPSKGNNSINKNSTKNHTKLPNSVYTGNLVKIDFG